jgi:hypothetical protein
MNEGCCLTFDKFEYSLAAKIDFVVINYWLFENKVDNIKKIFLLNGGKHV